MNGTVTKISGNVANQGVVVNYSISPDNKYVMYVTSQGILYVACSDGSDSTRVSPGTVSSNSESFKWSPISSHIAYRADHEVDTRYELFVFELATGQTTKVSGELPPGGDVDGQVSINNRKVYFQWSPDGSALAYTADQELNNDFELYVSAVDGSSNVIVSTGTHIGTFTFFRPDFSWSPDSSYIAYRVDENIGHIRLYVASRDGASNRGIQEIRELKENIRFMPTGSRYKIIIIDEVHMLTTEAFNALLKTLEEPPAHVYFMFATTGCR